MVLDKFDCETPAFLSEYPLLITDAVLTRHWHTFALSAQIHICYTEDAQKHIKTESCCEQTSGLGVCFLHREKEKEEHL